MKIRTGSVLKKRYEVIESLGRGGMAEVYLVQDKVRGVSLAMKVLREDLAEDVVFIRRFKREAQTLGKLKHPNIVRFYGLEQEGSLAFLLMEYIDGVTLRGEIFNRKRPFTHKRVLEIMEPICASLQYAHQQGLVHCDVKSTNIMIDRSGKVLLTDFGIARHTETATATMVGAGAPAYMAPEQIKGEDPTPQTDIYALGVVLFEMLSGGLRPFMGESEDTTGSTAQKIAWEHLHTSAPSLRKYNKNIPSQLDGIVQKCLHKKPEERFKSASQLITTLAAVITRKTTPADKGPDKQPQIAVKSISDREQVKPKKKASPTYYLVGIGAILFVCYAVISAINNQSNDVQKKATPTIREIPTATAAILQPKIATADRALAAYESGMDYLGGTTLMSESEPLLFINGWYAIDQSTLEDNLSNMANTIYINGEQVQNVLIAQADLRVEDSYPGREFFILIEDWPPGEHEIRLETTFLADINDGWFDFESGSEIYLYTIKVSENSSSSGSSQKQLLYHEDFSYDNYEWILTGPDTEDNFTSSADYKNGKYEVSLNSHEEISTGFASSYIKLIGDYQVSVDAALISGDKELACYGLIFGYEYWWEICEDQYFQIFKFVEEEVSTIEEWKYSSSISSTSDNHISVSVTGNQVQLFINDTMVSSFNASTPTDGYLYLFLNTYEANSGTFTFDNVEIYMP